MKNSEFAVSVFKSGFNCSQSVVSTFSEQLGISKELALKLSCGFGAGMGRLQETCGAVTGAYMVIGLKYGKGKPEEDHLREKTYKLVQDFSERFKKKYKTTNCKELLNCDLRTEEGRKLFKEGGLHDSICSNCVKDAVIILDDMLTTK